MATAKKRPTSAAPAAAKAKAAMATLGVVALERLRDPKVRAQLAQQGRSVADRAKAWNAERKHDASASPDKASWSKTGPLGDQFGQRKLERRVRSLHASVAELANGRPELAETLAVPTATLKEISSALTVAGGLPLVKRKRAHLQIGHELGQLEATVFEVAMPKAD